MPNTNITIRMDSELKQQAEMLFSDLGMNMTTAMTVFAKQAVREQRIPFIIDNLPNRTTLQAIEDARAGVGLSKSFSSIAELMEDLNADD